MFPYDGVLILSLIILNCKEDLEENSVITGSLLRCIEMAAVESECLMYNIGRTKYKNL